MRHIFSPAGEVRKRMMGATKRLLSKGVAVICVGCAGIAGMDRIVRDACVQELGEEQGLKVRIIDGVKSGQVALEGLVKVSVIQNQESFWKIWPFGSSLVHHI